MSGPTVQINLKINFPVILFTVLFVHALLLGVRQLNFAKVTVAEKPEERAPLQIRDIQNIRTVGIKESKIRNSVFVPMKPAVRNDIGKDNHDAKNLSLKDLTAATKVPANIKPMVRPGTIPEQPKAKAITGITLKGEEIKKFTQDSMAARAGGSTSATLNNTNIGVNLEVPEGVTPDQLNEYELMFYGFQRRTAINYVNAFYKNLDKFQRENPHINFPMTESKQIMTGRLTYDEKGNVKQIKMIRWSNVDKLQDFFVDVIKDMDTLHNPPHALWEKTGEFSIFFTFVVNG